MCFRFQNTAEDTLTGSNPLGTIALVMYENVSVYLPGSAYSGGCGNEFGIQVVLILAILQISS